MSAYDWMASAACTYQAEEFFPEFGDRAADAKKICARCPVQAECAAFASRHDDADGRQAGIWAGLSQRQRPTAPHRHRNPPRAKAEPS